MSGIPSLAVQVAKEEQLAFLLRTVRFDCINLDRQADMEELVQLIYSYANRAGLDVSPLATKDFVERLAFSCCYRWGLVIELLIEAFTLCRLADDDQCSKDKISQAFSQKYSTVKGYSPFTLSNYRDSFDHDILLQALDRSR